MKRSLGFAAFALVAACDGTTPSSDGAAKFGESTSTAADSAAVVALNGRLQIAARAGNWAAWATDFVVDPVRFPPNVQPVIGKAAADAFNSTSPTFATFDLATTWVAVRGDLATATVTYRTSIAAGRDAAGKVTPAANDDGKFMQILMKQSDGSWKIARDIWNSNLPAPSAATRAPR